MSRNRHGGSIELSIDHLVLHGFPRADRHRIGEAIRQELLRQLGERGLPDALARRGHIPRLNAGAIKAQAGGKPETIGTQVARAVFGSVVGEPPRGNDARSPSRVQAGPIDKRVAQKTMD
jgi:hypothetical protein